MAAPRSKSKDTKPATPREVRLWAADNGHTVGTRGRLSATVRAAFTAATGRDIV